MQLLVFVADFKTVFSTCDHPPSCLFSLNPFYLSIGQDENNGGYVYRRMIGVSWTFLVGRLCFKRCKYCHFPQYVLQNRGLYVLSTLASTQILFGGREKTISLRSLHFTSCDICHTPTSKLLTSKKILRSIGFPHRLYSLDCNSSD